MKHGILAAALVGLMGSAVAQSVTVGTSGADYTSLNAAIQAVGADSAAPDVITFIDEGPFFESRVVINESTGGTDDITIQASPGLRPVVVVKINPPEFAGSAFYLRKIGNLIVKDLIILPTTDFDESNRGAVLPQAGLEVTGANTEADGAIPTSVTLQNILISSNDGNNQPVASLDGLTPPVFDSNTVSFRDEGIQAPSTSTGAPRNLYMYDVVVSGVSGEQGSDGIRGFLDGDGNSEWIIGPGCVVTYNNHTRPAVTRSIGNAAIQVGGNTALSVKVQGTQDKPIILANNNLNGFFITDSGNISDGLDFVNWVIVANNSGAGFSSVDVNGPIEFENVTFANNGDGVLFGPESADEVVYTFSNVIAAGNGDASGATNNIELITGPSSGIFASMFTASDSATVLNGPHTLNTADWGGDGINNDSKWTVTLTDITTADPQFLSLDLLHSDFGAVGNIADYGTAGPGGSALVGGGTLGTSSVQDWQLF